MSSEADYELKLEDLMQWFKKKPNLPEEIDHLLLKRFLKCMSGNVEETKKLIELNYALRNKHNHIFVNRDPQDENVKKSRAANDLVPLPGLTPERYKILFFRMSDSDPTVVNSVEECKIFFMIADCRFIMSDDEVHTDEAHNLAEGDVQIVDIGSYSLAHLARISFQTLRVHLKYLQEAYPVRLRAMHVINCPTYIDKMIAIVKPFIREEVYKMIHLHTEGLDSLYEHVPRDMLPEEYGGKAGKLDDLKDKWTQTMHDHRDYLMDSKHWKVEQANNRSRWSWF